MKETQFVYSGDLKTLEQYGASLITGMISLKTLENFHLCALSQGLLDTDEEEVAKSICWEIKRLLRLYSDQFLNIQNRVPIESDKIMKDLQKQSLKAARLMIKKGKGNGNGSL